MNFDVLVESQLLDAFERFVECRNAHRVHFLAVHPTVVAREVPQFRALLNTADLVVADGAPIAALLRLRGSGGRRITATDGFLRLCRDPRTQGLKHYLVGGTSAEVTEAIAAQLRRRFPSLHLVGSAVPPFRPYTDEELAQLVDDIRSSGATVVWVGIGAPKQDVLAERLRAARAATIIACIGATFDFVAGTKPRAPRWMRAAGLEWVFRLYLEPRRLWRRYAVGNVRFLVSVAADALSRPFSVATEATASCEFDRVRHGE